MKIYLILALVLTLVSCQQKENTNLINDEPIQISNTWMRAGTANRNTAAFITIKNNIDVDDTLFSVSSDLAKVVEIHETYTKENDIKGMRHVEYLVIPSRSIVELKPGSYHIMLIGLNKDLQKGELVKIKLYFKVNGEKEIDLMVE